MNELHQVYGMHAVKSALRRGAVRELWVQAGRRDARLGELKRLAREAGVPSVVKDKRELDAATSGARHQGVVACIAARTGAALSLEELLQSLDRDTALLLVLDGVQDPHNLGACLRSADAAGAQAAIIPRDRAVGLTAAVRKVAAGAAEQVPVIEVPNLTRALKRIQKQGIFVVGLTEDADSSLFENDLAMPLALVLGAEDKGLRRLTRENCDLLVHLPMAGSVANLNVSVAAGVALFEARRQRLATHGA